MCLIGHLLPSYVPVGLIKKVIKIMNGAPWESVVSVRRVQTLLKFDMMIPVNDGV